MNFTAVILCLVVLMVVPEERCTQLLLGHKSEAAIERMTPEQLVEEYCKEYERHSFWCDYIHPLGHRIENYGLEAIPALARVIDSFDPIRSKGGRTNAESYAAEGLLSSIDYGIARLRAFESGRAAIGSVGRLSERLKAAHFDTAEDEGEYSPQSRFETTKSLLEELEGINGYDRRIQDTLKLKYRLKLSDDELLSFVNYLVAQDPLYPSWSAGDWYKDLEQINEAGNPLQYGILASIQPFYDAYLDFKARQTERPRRVTRNPTHQ